MSEAVPASQASIPLVIMPSIFHSSGPALPEDWDTDSETGEDRTVTAVDYYQERVSQDEQLRSTLRSLWEENEQLRVDNETLRAELREIQLRLSQMCAVINARPDASDCVCKQDSLLQRRDALVRLLTRDRSSDWNAYVNSIPDGMSLNAAITALHTTAKAAIPHFEQRVRAPQPSRRTSIWNRLVKVIMKDTGTTRAVAEGEVTKRMRESLDALDALALLNDEALWHFVFQK